jgi:uncharacterized protein RhaS with RHS repeats
LPELGRFLTQDPLGHEAGLNLYEYASNNPLTHLDPEGLQSLESVTPSVREAVRRSLTEAIRNPRQGLHELRLFLEDLGEGGGKAAEKFVERAVSNAERLVSAEERFAGQSNAQIANQFLRGEAQQKLKEVFGQGAKQALERLKNFSPRNMPKGMSRDTLESYLEVARRAVAAGKDSTGVQETRMAIMQRALQALGRRTSF